MGYAVAGALRKYELKDAGYTQFGADITNLFDLDIVITPAKDLLLPAVEIARGHMLSVKEHMTPRDIDSRREYPENGVNG